MLHRETVTIFPAIRKKHINTIFYGQNIGFLILKICCVKKRPGFARLFIVYHLIIWEPKTHTSSCVLIVQFFNFKFLDMKGPALPSI